MTKPKPPELICYSLTNEPPLLRPAPATRPWMDATPEKYAYRCLPLSIANAHGWELLVPSPFMAEWRGSKAHDGVTVTSLSGGPAPAMSHFGSGVLTFHVNALFRTDPGWNLFVGGPLNRPKHGIQGLTGLIETDWTVASFTMNWMFTAPGRVTFAEGEPFCFFFPVQRGHLDTIEPRSERIAAPQNRAVYDQYVAWRDGRAKFLKDLPVAGSEANQAGWEKSYFQGSNPNGQQGVADHQTRLRLKPFAPPKP
ncbi:MAG: hypothetical protein JWM77_3445 [Rhodospirillales bacterium]|nr:hypothetical protein [Rhodospirillales bacterium]